MKAPDKMYVTESMETEKVLFGIWTNKDPLDTVSLQYINKDTLLDWLKQSKQEMEQELKGTDGLKMAMTATAISSFQEVINKLESL